MTYRVRRIIVVSASFVLLATLAGVGFIAGVRVNLTPSFPLGLWRIEPFGRDVAVGDRIFICPPALPAFRMARERGYLGYGLCPEGFSPLIKTVIATAGQHVAIGDRIAVDGAPIDHSLVRGADGDGRALDPDAGGIVPEGKLFLFSEFEGSYDSRYFGPVPVTGLLGLAHPLLVLDPRP